jgi:hypothetical protein
MRTVSSLPSARRALVWVALSAVLALLVLPASGLARGSFKTGVYSGTTSQGFAFKLAVRNESNCPRSRHLCIFTPRGTTPSGGGPSGSTTQAYLSMPCTSGGSDNDYVDLDLTPVPRSGVIHQSTTGFSVVTVTIKISHHGTMSGTFEATGTASDSTSDCTSGVVTFTART